MESVFTYFHNKEVDFNKPSDDTKKKGKSGEKTSNFACNLDFTSEEKAKKIEEASKLKSEENLKQDGMNDYIESKQEPANNTEDTSELEAKEIKEQEKSSFNTFMVSSEQGVMNANAENRPTSHVSVNVQGTGKEIVIVQVKAKDAKDIHVSITITGNQKDDQPT
jgi:tRNA threonylcarbamoyladenosine modification (KEOPS) complex  Pcc1 subunit